MRRLRELGLPLNDIAPLLAGGDGGAALREKLSSTSPSQWRSWRWGRRSYRVAALECEPIDAVRADAGGSALAGAREAVTSAVVFDRVSFRYPGSAAPTLRGVSFTVPARGLVAVVGPSGAGKSTLFALLERF